VAPAPQLDAIDARRATQGMRIDMVELHEPTLVAAMATGPHEGATPQVA
jgi:hypothetical protein